MKEFSITVKFIRIENFDDAVLMVTINYGDKEYTQEKVVELPPFKSIGQKILEQLLYETAWILRKDWEPREPEEYSMYEEPEEPRPVTGTF